MEFIIITLNITLSIYICLSDYYFRKIKNHTSLLIFINNLYPFIYYSTSHIETILFFSALHLFLYYLWKLNYIGGGDVKLLLAFAIGIEFNFYILYLATIGILGGGVVLIMHIFSSLKNKSAFKDGVPYGIPISISGSFYSTLSIIG